MEKICRVSLISLCVGFVFFACTRKSEKPKSLGPERVVRAFVEMSATAKTVYDKHKLEALCMGEMRRAFGRMTKEVFELSYLNNKVTLENLEFLDVSTDGDKAKVRYRVTILNQGGTDETREKNEREVELSKARGSWLLENIKPVGQDEIAFTRGMIF